MPIIRFSRHCAMYIRQIEQKATAYVNVLYNQALLIEGLTIEDPVAYANAVCSLLTK